MYKSFNACKAQLDGVQSIDFFLARRLCQSINSNSSEALLFHSIMATTQALRDGHSCLKLDESAESFYWSNSEEDKQGYQFPNFDEWQKYLSDLPLSPDDSHPLVYENKRLYLRRYWQFEETLGKAIRHIREKKLALDLEAGKQVIDQLFPVSEKTNANIIDWQKMAVANALGRQFTIIAGGPGTGKTFTVTKILAALQILSGNTCRIAMVAPTGKAAQRLNESIQKAKFFLKSDGLVSEETLNTIPDSASTLHRLLKVKYGSHNFHHDESNHLPFNVILVDEISMIDLPLMTRLMRAINPSCQVIMLGDADQLPSVAAGSVLADLAPRDSLGYSDGNRLHLNALTGANLPIFSSHENEKENEKERANIDHLTVLQHSRRFESGGEIGALAGQVIAGNAMRSWGLLAQGKEQIERVKRSTIADWVGAMVEQYYTALFSLDVTEAFNQLNQFRFLAATRQGEQGVTQINEMVEHYLRKKGLIKTQSEFYPGRPIMITENHYHVGLYNGDTGILWEKEDGKLAAAFPQTQDTEAGVVDISVRWLSLGRLPNVETVYAMTIHKTQGSEFGHVGLVLPERDSPILSRELLYTGITRASEQLSVWSDKSIWVIAVKRKVQRYSGLPQRVFGVSDA